VSVVRHDTDTCGYIQLFYFSQIITGFDVSVLVSCPISVPMSILHRLIKGHISLSGTLSADEWDAAYLYMSFVLRKVSSKVIQLAGSC
jgi:hypothetical protein